MDRHEKIAICLLIAALAAILYLSSRPVQVDISPAPSKPLSNDTVGESEHDANPNRLPDVSAYRGAFMFPLSFMSPMPIISTRLR